MPPPSPPLFLPPGSFKLGNSLAIARHQAIPAALALQDRVLNDGTMRSTGLSLAPLALLPRVALALALALTLTLSGCAPAPGPTAPVPSSPGPPESTAPSPQPTPAVDLGRVAPAGTPTVLITGLATPWSVVRIPSGSALISERDSGTVLEFTSTGKVRTVGIVPGVVHRGEGGLLGLAVLMGDTTVSTNYLYAYFTSASDNRIVRMPLLGGAGHYSLGTPEPLLTGLKKAQNHDGGRIAIGPDGKLYATVGDVTQPNLAQSMESLNGKILRMNLDGSVPSDNPFPGSLIYTLGHRNPQGLAWDASGQLWASELGQNTWDEFNRIVAGKNYGWPIVEGQGHKTGYVDPVLQWPTSQASPSGLAFVRGTFFMASLRGKRLWVIDASPDTGVGAGIPAVATDWFVSEYGRLRDAIPGPDGTLWVLTSNTDINGIPQPGDDRLLQIQLDTVVNR